MSNKQLFSLTEQFIKYAQFLSGSFGVKIDFNATGAHRQENTIYIPSLATLSPAQVKLLWGSVLLECGLLKHSQIASEEVLLELKSLSHAQICNTIEAARVKLQLQQEFTGAGERLEPLFLDALDDEVTREKFFPSEQWNSAWGCLNYYLHEKIMNKSDEQILEGVKKLASPKVLKEFKAIMPKLQLSNLVNLKKITSATSSTKDSVKLARVVYDQFFSIKKDTSEKLDYAGMLKRKQEAQKEALKVQAILDAHRKKIESLNNKTQAIRAQLKEQRAVSAPLVAPLEALKKSQEAMVNNLQTVLNYTDNKTHLQNTYNQFNQSLQDYQAAAAAAQAQKDFINQRLQQSGSNQNSTQSIAQEIQNKIDALGAKDSAMSASEIEEVAQRVQAFMQQEGGAKQLSLAAAAIEINQVLDRANLTNDASARDIEEGLKDLNKLAKAKSELEAMEQLVQTMKPMVVDGNRANNAGQEQNNSMDASELQKASDIMEQQINELEAKMERDKEILEKLQSLSKLQKNIARQDSKVAQDERKLEALNKKLTAAQNSEAPDAQKIKDLKDKMAMTSDELEESREKLAQLKEAKDELTKDVQGLAQQAQSSEEKMSKSEFSSGETGAGTQSIAQSALEEMQALSQSSQSGNAHSGGQGQESDQGGKASSSSNKNSSGASGQSGHGGEGAENEASNAQGAQGGKDGKAAKGGRDGNDGSESSQTQTQQSSPLDQLEEQINQARQRAKELKKQASAIDDALSKMTITPQEAQKLQKKLTSLDGKINNNNAKASKTKSKIETALDAIEAHEQSHKSAQQSLGEKASSSHEELHNEIKQLEEQIKAAEKQLDQINQKENALVSSLNTAKQELTNSVTQATQEMYSSGSKVQSIAKEMGLELDLVPEFKSMQGWPEADEQQHKMDSILSQKTNRVVISGAGLQAGDPNKLEQVSLELNKVSEFDIRSVFSNVASLNPIKDLYSSADQTSQSTDSIDRPGVGRAVRPHVPVSTQYDETITVNKPLSTKAAGEFEKIKTDLRADIMQIKQSMKAKFKFNKKPLYKGGKEEGDLDARSLYKLATGLDNNYWEVTKSKFTSKLCASILVDISGSHNKDYTNNGQKLKELSLLLSEGLSECHIPHMIMGYCAPVNHELKALGVQDTSYNRRSNSLKHYVYKKFEDKSNSGIANMEIEPQDNCDSESVREAWKSLKKRQEKTKILFIISDGKPFLSDADISVLDEDLRKALREVVEQGGKICSLSFNSAPQDIFAQSHKTIKNYKDLCQYIKSEEFDLNMGQSAKAKSELLKAKMGR